MAIKAPLPTNTDTSPIDGATVVQNAAFLTVTKAGYFKGIKTFIAQKIRKAFFRIKLIPKNLSGTISGSGGGTVSLSNGLSISLPANAVVTASGGSAYTGPVRVAAYHINPNATDLDMIMPGDLRGINTSGEIKLLKTYGMAAVELTGASGELLQIATGKKATLSLPVPSSLLGDAPPPFHSGILMKQMDCGKKRGLPPKPAATMWVKWRISLIGIVIIPYPTRC